MLPPSGDAEATEADSTLGGSSVGIGLAEPAPVSPRRRGKALEAAIFHAVLDELVSSGYARLGMESVAARARTGKAALYRRWASKEELVMDALRACLPTAAPAPDTGDLRDDLLELAMRMRAAFLSPTGCAARAIMSEVDHERAARFLGLMHERVIDPGKALLQEVLERGVARGDVRPGAPGTMVVDVLPALMMYRTKMHGPPTEQDVVALVDEVLLPIVRA